MERVEDFNEMVKKEEIENGRVEAEQWKGWRNVVNSRAGKRRRECLGQE